MESIGSRLKEFGLSHFSSLKKFAESLSMSPQNLNQYLADSRQPGTNILIKLSQLGCDINWLLLGNDPSLPNMVSESATVYRARPPENDEVQELRDENEILRKRIAAISELSGSIGKLKQRKLSGTRGG